MNLASASFFEMSLYLQIALGAGYLAYAISYAGFRKEHSVADQVAISLIFSSVALVIVNNLGDLPNPWRIALTLTFTIIVGALWRMLGRPFCLGVLREFGIHREDGIHSGWASLVQTKKAVGQASVFTTDGKLLHLADRSPYKDLEWEGLYLCGDGSVIMVVDDETDENGVETPRNDILDANWGVRYTYIPAHNIKRVELRMK